MKTVVVNTVCKYVVHYSNLDSIWLARLTTRKDPNISVIVVSNGAEANAANKCCQIKWCQSELPE